MREHGTRSRRPTLSHVFFTQAYLLLPFIFVFVSCLPLSFLTPDLHMPAMPPGGGSSEGYWEGTSKVSVRDKIE